MQARTLVLQSINPSAYADGTDLSARNPVLGCCAKSEEVKHEPTFTHISAYHSSRLCPGDEQVAGYRSRAADAHDHKHRRIARSRHRSARRTRHPLHRSNE